MSEEVMYIGEIEQKIIDELSVLKAEAGVKVVDSYRGDLDALLADPQMIKQFPAIFVVYLRSDFKKFVMTRDRRKGFRVESRFRLLSIAQDFRGDKKMRIGERGVYALINAIVGMLTNVELGLAEDKKVAALIPERVEIVESKRYGEIPVVAAQIEFSLEHFLPAVPLEGTDWVGIVAGFYLKPSEQAHLEAHVDLT